MFATVQCRLKSLTSASLPSPFAPRPLQVPICVSSCRIGPALVLDTTGAEQACASTFFSVAVDRDGTCCGLVTSAGGAFAPTDVAAARAHAAAAAATIFKSVDRSFAEASADGAGECLFPDVPPMRLGMLA